MCTLVYVQRPEQGTGYSAPSLLFQLISLRRAISLNLATDSESSGPSWPQSGNPPGPAAERWDTTQFISEEVLDLTKTISADRGKKGSFSQTLSGGGGGAEGLCWGLDLRGCLSILQSMRNVPTTCFRSLVQSLAFGKKIHTRCI